MKVDPMEVGETRVSRREMLRRGAGLLGGVVLSLTLEANKPAMAKAAKSDFLYQDHPRDGKACAQCKFFSPDRDSATTGTCALVDGVVNRTDGVSPTRPESEEVVGNRLFSAGGQCNARAS